jgi:PRTRC genetic system ThiF family protein
MSKRANKISQPALDLGYLNAATILARQPETAHTTIVLAGCGGTGSYMAMHIGRILAALADRGQPARAVFVDHDHVEEKNIGRQLFCRAELGLNKADALTLRYGSAWGLSIVAMPMKFKASLARPQGGELVVIVGCVDNAEARKEISRALKYNPAGSHDDRARVEPPKVWWLDCGNHEDAGQVLLGSALNPPKQLRKAFPSKDICQALPAPSVQRPELVVSQNAKKKAPTKLSCAELTAANLQSLNINAAIAAIAADFLTRLLVTRDLKRFACEINLAAGSMRSTYATPQAVGVGR